MARPTTLPPEGVFLSRHGAQGRFEVDIKDADARTINVSVQVLPIVENLGQVVDRAISVIQASGVKYEVDAMETVMEGPLDELIEVAKAAHRACFEAGARQVVTIIKIADRIGGTTIEEKVSPYRGRED